ncbi:hypothetical protein ACFCV3_41665 [Kribbella sp. NPDC056345]|uniref:hypothetical protein n=1 Tax=Kribbella sp. NPDC056345 TaxID=3345789 RepID=UPI0035E01FCB
MGRPAKPKPAPIEPEDALDRLHTRYGGDSPRSVFEAAVSDLQTGRSSDRAVVLDALAMLMLLREELDEHERELLRIGHDELSMAMSDLAPGLGVTSRQAAEQRYQRRLNGANPSSARRRRSSHLSFFWWVKTHQADVIAAVEDLLVAVNGSAQLKTGDYTLIDMQILFKIGRDAADAVTAAETTYDPETVAKADRVNELHRMYRAAQKTLRSRRDPDEKRVQLAPIESWGE